MKIRRVCIAIVFATSCIVNELSGRADLLLNSSFETPRATGTSADAFFPGAIIGSGWTVDPLSNSAALLVNTTLFPSPPPPNGDQYLLISDGANRGTIRQDVFLDASTPYRLAFAFRAEPNSGFAAVGIDVLIGGSSLIGGPSYYSTTNSIFEMGQLSFNSAFSGTYTVQVSALGGAVAIDAFNLFAIPEPSSSLLVTLVGLASFLRVRWSRNVEVA
jgi:hypothetical protein